MAQLDAGVLHKMKEFLGWIVWLWRSWETWQKWFVVGMFFTGASISAEGLAQQIIVLIPISIFGFYLTKWAIIDNFKASWAKYKSHRNELLTTIKHSEQQGNK